MSGIFDNPINLDSPDFVIPLRSLKSASDIYIFCRNNGIRHYGYGFRYARTTYSIEQIKFGYSSPDPIEKPAAQGERLVRQASWIPGWNNPVYSSHGFELWHGCQGLIADGILPVNTNYTDIEIAIWSTGCRTNLTGYKMSDKETAAVIESTLCDLYYERHGRLPPLNISDPRTNKLYKMLTKTTALQIFTFS
jgi:hypothetical protein